MSSLVVESANATVSVPVSSLLVSSRTLQDCCGTRSLGCCSMILILDPLLLRSRAVLEQGRSEISALVKCAFEELRPA